MSDDPPGSYRPGSYWSDRLGDNFNLRGTGHQAYDEEYNRWLYKAKEVALRKALRGLPAGGAALDIGSGVGWVIQELLDRGLAVEGADISPESVTRLRERFPAVPIFELSLGAQPIERPDATFDVVTMLDVAYHVVDDEIWRVGVAEIIRVLKPGGRLVISDGLGETDAAAAGHVRFRSRGTWSAVGGDRLRIEKTGAYFRWLSRERAESWMNNRFRDGWRGAIEYGLERAVPRRPHMRWAVLRKASAP